MHTSSTCVAHAGPLAHHCLRGGEAAERRPTVSAHINACMYKGGSAFGSVRLLVVCIGRTCATSATHSRSAPSAATSTQQRGQRLLSCPSPAGSPLSGGHCRCAHTLLGSGRWRPSVNAHAARAHTRCGRCARNRPHTSRTSGGTCVATGARTPWPQLMCWSPADTSGAARRRVVRACAVAEAVASVIAGGDSAVAAVVPLPGRSIPGGPA